MPRRACTATGGADVSLMKRAQRARVAVSLTLLALSFGGVSCAKQDSVAERNAEIDRRIEERLAAHEEAAAQQRLAQERVALAAREKALAEREASFAMMIASGNGVPEAAEPEPMAEGDNSLLASEPYSDPQTYSTYSQPSVSAYEQPYGYDGYVANEDPFYSDPYYCPPTTGYYSVITSNAVVVNRRGNFRRQGTGRPPRGNHGMSPAGMPARQPRPPVVSRPPVNPRPPMVARQTPAARPPAIHQRPTGPTVGQRPTRSMGGSQVTTTRRGLSRPVAQTR